MPIKVQDSLPAKEILESENIFVMTQFRAEHQDIRPLKLLILNLMPTKVVTETQLLRKLSNSPLQIEVQFLQTVSHLSRNTDPGHLESFYRSFEDVRNEYYDGMIITGAPVENMDFEDVDYWPELCQIMNWTTSNVHSTMHICWGAQAGLYYHYHIEKIALDKKLSGVYSHRLIKPKIPFFRGFDDVFDIPHSRNTTVRESDIVATPGLELLAVSDEAGVFAVKSADNKRFFITGHPEYDAETLNNEYHRDLDKGINPEIPQHYYPNDDPTQAPIVRWRAHAQLLYSNWLNYYVYQTTPFDIKAIASEKSE